MLGRYTIAKLIEKMKKDPSHKDISAQCPVILT